MKRESQMDMETVRPFGSDDPVPSHRWSLVSWAGPGAVLGGALSKVGPVAQCIWVLCYSLSSSICLLINYSLNTYYVLSPGDSHEPGPGLPVCTLPTFPGPPVLTQRGTC